MKNNIIMKLWEIFMKYFWGLDGLEKARIAIPACLWVLLIPLWIPLLGNIFFYRIGSMPSGFSWLGFIFLSFAVIFIPRAWLKDFCEDSFHRWDNDE